jgi:phage tail-like protein
MAKFSGTSRADPYRNFNFRVISSGRVSAGFTEVTGLRPDTPEAEHRRAAATAVRKVPGLHKTADVILKRGVMAVSGFGDRTKARASAESRRSNMVIEQYDAAGRKIASFALARCRVLEVVARKDRDARADVVKVVTLKLQCQGGRRKPTAPRRTKRRSK